MAYFEVMLSGKGISLPFEGTTEVAIGFYVSRLVRGENQADAENAAKEMVLSEWRSGRFASNRGAQPALTVNSVARIGMLQALWHRQTGYSFYSEEGA